MAIFHFPSFEAAIVRPWLTAIERSPVTANSRPMMMHTAQASASCRSTSEMSAAEIRSLSAMGSRSVPIVVTFLKRRAQ